MATAGRKDLRKFPLVTIDPEDARDHDDAVWAGPDSDPANRGGHIVIVAIADVAEYVRSGSVLDREALKRGNSVYFPDRVVPMLPEALSADLCSLREDRGPPLPRRAHGVRFPRGEAPPRIHAWADALRRAADLRAGASRRSTAHPDAKCRKLQDKVMLPLWDAYRTVTKERAKRSPLDLDLPERRIVFGEDGQIASVAFRERLESMRLIEEFMIMANVAAAETLEKARQSLIYRVHEQPEPGEARRIRRLSEIHRFFLRQRPGDQTRGVQPHSRTRQRHAA